MIYDADTWIGHFPFQSLPKQSAPELVDLMDRHGIDKALVGNLNGLLYKDAHEANHELHRAIAGLRDRLVPCAVINPTYFGWRRDLQQCREQFGMPVVRMLPDYHGYILTDPSAAELVAEAQQLGMPVALFWRIVDPRGRHRLDPGREANPADVAKFVRGFPDAKFLLLNFRDVLPGPLDDPHQRLYDIPLFAGDNGLRPAREFRKHNRATFAFGTTMPLRSATAATLMLEKARLDPETLDAIQWKNLAQFVPEMNNS